MPIERLDQTFDGMSDLSPSDLPPERDLESELFNKRSIRDLVTNIERELGLNPGGKKGKNVKRHNRIIAPGRDEDAEILTQILNDDAKYRILLWKDTWTVHGDYRIFLIYEEQLEDKKIK